TVHSAYAAQGDSLHVFISMTNREQVNIRLNGINIDGNGSTYNQPLDYNKNYSFTENFIVPENKPITQPYWLVEEMSPGSYNVKDQSLIGDAQTKPAYDAQIRLTIEGQEFTIHRPVQYKYTHPVRGELYEPFTILPDITGRFDPETIIFTSDTEKEFDVQTRNQSTRNIDFKVSLTRISDISFKNEGNSQNATFSYSAEPLKKESAVFYSSLVRDENGKPDSLKELKTISYDHIPRIDYFRDSKAKFVITDVRIEGTKIGYIEGAGDKVPEALQQMGYEVIFLKEKDILPGNLRQFDAIIAGVRAYDVHDWLFSKYDVLMNYVNEGGNLIVQYNRNNLGSTKIKIGPYPFAIANIRVTDEKAKVSFLQPTHPVLNYPNKISDKDFDGWIQERGIYFAGETDPNYQAVFSMHDPGESGQNGSLIVADYGKGKFVYTGLVFFRELPAGVPGAYRLMANIIALNHKRGF
ncbi:MAG TPA: hypothetical protein VMH01_08550, partial [Puia sp.]|nr:hypothetical protein [Puia sp.]